MSEQKPISHADLARYWGCSPPNITNLVRRKGMPEFTSLRQADEWRAVNAPIRKRPRLPENTPTVSPKSPVASPEKIAGSSVTTTTPPQPPARDARPTTPEQPDAERRPSPPPPQRINVAQFVRPDVDFIELQIRNATELAQITFGLLKLKTEEGEPGAIAAASKNWHETSKAAADVIEKYVARRREAGTLIPIDDVEDIIATELEELRRGLKRLGRRAAALANPDNPTLAEAAINAQVDKLLAALANLTDRARLELAERETVAAAAGGEPPAAEPASPPGA